MQVANTTSQDTRYTVSSVGSAPPITPPSGVLLQGRLKPGESREVEPVGKGPWKVMFLPEGGDRVVATVRSAGDGVSLTKDDEGFCCEVLAAVAATV